LSQDDLQQEINIFQEQDFVDAAWINEGRCPGGCSSGKLSRNSNPVKKNSFIKTTNICLSDCCMAQRILARMKS